MSDDLVKRLRKGDTPMANHYMDEAADRIEELESELSLLEEGLTAAYLAGSFDGRKEAEAKLNRIQGAISQQSLAEGDYGEEGRALAAEIYSILYKEEPNE